MNDLAERSDKLPAGLPANFAAKMLAGVQQVKSAIVASGGKPFFRMSTEGVWVYGQENNEIQPGSHWVANPMAMGHGFVCWQDSKLLGETMVSMSQAKPPMPEPINGKPFTDQWLFDLKCINGEDKGVEVRYKVSSYGGKVAVKALLDALEARWQQPGGTDYPCPVLEFSNSHYYNKKFNKETYNPELSIVGWTDMDGNLEPTGAASPLVPELEPVAPAAALRPKRTRARAEATAATAPAPAQTELWDETHPPREAPLPTAQTHTGQRRRPVAR